MEIQKEIAILYQDSQLVLEEIVALNSDAHEIRCWPHHFDIATLLPLKTDDSGEISQSIGVGFSPGDDTIDQPYYYVNIWPNVNASELQQHKLDKGHWYTEGLSGAVLLYGDILTVENQKSTVLNFLSDTISILKKIG